MSSATSSFNGLLDDVRIYNRALTGQEIANLYNAASVKISINDVSVTEGDAGTVDAAFTVALSKASSREVRVDYATADGTAQAGVDYQAASGTLTFSPGTTSAPVHVSILGDTLVEPDETFFVNLSNPVSATILDAQGEGRILNNDSSRVHNLNNGLWHSSIQGAIDAAANGHELVANPATYAENVQFKGKNLVLRSTDPSNPAVVASTIIDGNHTGPAVAFAGSETSACVLSGFTIKNGSASNGGGISGAGAAASIKNNHITANAASLRGGGLYSCAGAIQNNLISDNTAGGNGGGLASCNGAIQNNTVRSNQSGSQGGGLDQCAGTIKNCIIWGNTATGGNPQLNGGSTPTYSCIQGWAGGGTGNITGDPLFKAGDPPSRLQSLTDGDPGHSPCIDTGDPASAYGSEPLPNGQRVNMGRYGATSTAERSYMILAIHGASAVPENSSASYTCDLRYQNETTTISINPQWSVDRTDIAQINSSGLLTVGSVASDQTVTITAQYSEGGVSATDSKPVTVYNVPAASINDVSVQEGDSGTVDAVFTVSLSTPSSQEVRIGYATVDGTAQAGVDYQAASGTLTFSPGTTSAPVHVSILGDTLVEPDEAFFVNLSNPVNATILDAQGEGRILNNDSSRVHNLISGLWHSSIQGAIDAAANGHELVASPATYAENVQFKGKNLVLRSTDPSNPTVVASTIIDGNHAGPTVAFAGSETSACILSGFTVRNGSASNGGGINGAGAAAAIKNNHITSNTASLRGGGLYSCAGAIQNNLISDNTAGGNGGGLASCNGAIQNNTIRGNQSSSQGGGLDQCAGTIKNCIVWGNTATGGNPQLNGGSTPTYSCLQGWTGGGTGNITGDPLFKAGDPPSRLQSLTDGDPGHSPCIDTGDPASAYDAEPLPNGQRVNMGRYGATSTAERSYMILAIHGASAILENTSASYTCDLLYQNETTTFSINPQWSVDRTDIAQMNSSGLLTVGAVASDQTVTITAQYSEGGVSATDSKAATVYNVPAASVNDVTVEEGNSGTVDAVFTVSLSTPSSQEVRIDYNTADGTAQAGVDYQAASGTLILPPGTPSAPITVQVLGDTLVEPDETFLVNLSNPVNATIADAQGNGRILDDDGTRVRNLGHGTWYSTIQGAIDGASNGDELVANEGVYVENVQFGGKNVLLRSTDPSDPAVVARTIIDGNHAGPAVAFSGSETSACVLSGFTIKNGAASNGGGINGAGAAASIKNNHITSNTASLRGGGLYSCAGAIQNNLISDNTAGGNGGGLASCNGAIQNDTIRGNQSSSQGGGLDQCAGTIKNCIVWANTATGGNPQLNGGSTPTYSCIQGWTGGGTGNIAADPLFKAGDPLSRLQSLTDGDPGHSPCIDTGDPASAYGSEPLPNGQRINMGRYGATSAAERSYMILAIHGASAVAENSSASYTCDLLYQNETTTLPINPQWSVDRTDIAQINSSGLLTVGSVASDQTVTITAQYSEGGVSATDSKPVTVYNIPAASINDVSVQEGDSGTVDAVFTVSLSTPSSQEVRIAYATVDGTAQAGVDFQAASGTLILPPGTPSAPIAVHVLGDTLVEPDEIFLVNLSSPVNATILDAQGEGRILNDDASRVHNLTTGLWHSSIQGAIDAAANGHELVANPATYTENARFNGKNLTLRSTDPSNPTVVASTIIDGNHTGSAVAFSGSETSACVLSGFTIKNGSASNGGGINGAGAAALIKNNHITANTASLRGGGVYNCAGAIQNNLISDNTAGGNGGGLASCNGAIQNNTVRGNQSSSQGGGLDQCAGTIKNCVIWGNTATGGNPQLNGGSTPTYSCIQGWTGGGTGNITSDPLFKTGDPLSRLQSLTDGDPGHSPCIDTGDPSSAYGSEPLPNGQRVNMGRYGATSAAERSYMILAIHGPSAVPENSSALYTCDLRYQNEDTIVAINPQWSVDRTDIAQINASGLLIVGSVASDQTVALTAQYSEGGVSATDSKPVTVYNIPAASINDVSVQEGDSGTIDAVFTVSLSAPSSQEVRITYATADGTAQAGVDYQAASGTLILPPGTPSAPLSIHILGDMLDEPDRSFVVNLSNPFNAALDDPQGEGWVLDDDEPEAPRVSAPDATAYPLEPATVGIRVSFINDLRAITDLRIQYDRSVVSMPSSSGVAAGELLNGWFIAASVDESGPVGLIRISAVGMSAVSAPTTTTLFNLAFNVVGNPGDSTGLLLPRGGFQDNAGAAIPVQFQNGSIRIGIPNYCDISGTVGYWPDPPGLPVAGTLLSLSPPVTPAVSTDGSGFYRFDDLPGGLNCAVTPSSGSVAVSGAITAYDAGLVLDATVGNLTPNHWQEVAADVQGDADIDAFDAVLVLRYTVGMTGLPFPVGEVWAFEPGQRSYEPLSLNQFDQDYVAVLYGDVDGNWTFQGLGGPAPKPAPAPGPPAPQFAKETNQSPTPAHLSIPNASAPSGGPVDIEILGESIEDLTAITDLRIVYDPAILSVSGVSKITLGSLLEGSVMAANVDNASGLIRISLARTEPATGNGPVLRIAFDVNASAPGLQTPLHLVPGRLCDGSGQQVPATFSDGTLTVGDGPPTRVDDWRRY